MCEELVRTQTWNVDGEKTQGRGIAGNANPRAEQPEAEAMSVGG
jgi:hypothetical protein